MSSTNRKNHKKSETSMAKTTKTTKKVDALDILNAIITENIRKQRAADARIGAIIERVLPIGLTLLTPSLSNRGAGASASDTILAGLSAAFTGMTHERIRALVASGLFTEAEVVALATAIGYAEGRAEPKAADGKANGNDGSGGSVQ